MKENEMILNDMIVMVQIIKEVEKIVKSAPVNIGVAITAEQIKTIESAIDEILTGTCQSIIYEDLILLVNEIKKLLHARTDSKTTWTIYDRAVMISDLRILFDRSIWIASDKVHEDPIKLMTDMFITLVDFLSNLNKKTLSEIFNKEEEK